MKKIFFALFIISCWLAVFPAGVALATDGPSTKYGLDTAANTAGSLKSPGTSANTALANEIGLIVGVLLSFLGVIFLLLMIAGGLMWMTAGGNDSKVKTARSLLVAAIVGLIIVLSAYAITTFVSSNILSK